MQRPPQWDGGARGGLQAGGGRGPRHDTRPAGGDQRGQVQAEHEGDHGGQQHGPVRHQPDERPPHSLRGGGVRHHDGPGQQQQEHGGWL